MSCINCHLFHKVCKAECCTLAPIEEDVFRRNFTKLTAPVQEVIPFAPGIVILMTETGKCPFLNSELGCAIYEDRPAVCRKFGDETHLNLTCAHQTKDGKERPTKEKKKIQRLQKEQQNKFFGR